MHLSRVTYLSVLILAVLWCAAIGAAPLFVSWSGAWLPAGEFLYRFFHPICHQLGEKSPHLFGGPLAVCTRCSAIYIGFLCGVLVFPIAHRRIRWSSRTILGVALLPMVVDVTCGILGLHEATGLTRMITGGFFGALVPLVVLPVLMDAVLEIVSPSPVQPQKGSSNATAQ